MSLGFIDKRVTKAVAYTAGPNAVIATPANYATVATMKARLQAINGTYYTTARLASMNENDLTMALRQADDPLGI